MLRKIFNAVFGSPIACACWLLLSIAMIGVDIKAHKLPNAAMEVVLSTCWCLNLAYAIRNKRRANPVPEFPDSTWQPQYTWQSVGPLQGSLQPGMMTAAGVLASVGSSGGSSATSTIGYQYYQRILWDPMLDALEEHGVPPSTIIIPEIDQVLHVAAIAAVSVFKNHFAPQPPAPAPPAPVPFVYVEHSDLGPREE